MGPDVRCHLYWFAEHLGRKVGYQHYCVDPWLSVAVNTTHPNLIFFFFFDTFHGTLILNLNKKELQKKKKKFKSHEFPWVDYALNQGGLPGRGGTAVCPCLSLFYLVAAQPVYKGCTQR